MQRFCCRVKWLRPKDTLFFSRATFPIYHDYLAQTFFGYSRQCRLVIPMSLLPYQVVRNKILFSLFFTCITLPKNLLKYVLKGEFDHAKAFLKAISWNLRNVFSTLFNAEKPSETVTPPTFQEFKTLEKL